MIITGLTFRFLSIMVSRGVSQAEAPFILSVIALTGLPVTLLAGAILGKMKTNKAALLFTVLLSTSLIIISKGEGRAMAVTFAVVLGMSQGIQAVWGGLVWPEYFGTAHLGSIRGLAMATSIIASALGPVLFGVVFDFFGTYMSMFIVCLVLSGIGALFAVITKKPCMETIKNNFEP
ncbi:MAG: hypothetical protein PHQ55_06340 [Eubacteriales bacterium]|nr:hypothetical protein [Eubacteriales bacterium]